MTWGLCSLSFLFFRFYLKKGCLVSHVHVQLHVMPLIYAMINHDSKLTPLSCSYSYSATSVSPYGILFFPILFDRSILLFQGNLWRRWGACWKGRSRCLLSGPVYSVSCYQPVPCPSLQVLLTPRIQLPEEGSDRPHMGLHYVFLCHSYLFWQNFPLKCSVSEKREYCAFEDRRLQF